MSKKIQTPWGSWEVLRDAETYKVKEIVVLPGQRLSYQKHSKREEYWTIVQGEATVILNGESHSLKKGQQIHIPLEALHRIANETDEPVIFVEIQLGSYFGEDDIVRLEDDYGRL